MRRVLIWFACCFFACVVSAHAQPPDPTPVEQPVEVYRPYADPYTVVQQFFWLAQSGQFQAASGCINVVEHDANALERMVAEIKRVQGTMEFRITNVVLEKNGSDATVNVAACLMNPLGMGVVWHEVLNLRPIQTAQGREWRLQPSVPHIVLENAADGYLQRLVTCFAYPQTMLEQIKQRECAKQIKQLTLGVMQFVQDYNEQFAFTEKTLKEKLTPYLRDSAVWTAPGDAVGTQSFSFNPRLFGATTRNLRWNETVIFYMGKDQQLDFRFNGKALVGFMSGVDFVDKEQSKNLRWEP